MRHFFASCCLCFKYIKQSKKQQEEVGLNTQFNFSFFKNTHYKIYKSRYIRFLKDNKLVLVFLFLSNGNLLSIVENVNKEFLPMISKIEFKNENLQNNLFDFLLYLNYHEVLVNYLFSCYFCLIVWIFINQIDFQLFETESLKKGERMTKSQLIRDIAGNNISLENALLRLKIITYSLNNLSLQKWIENELRGYKIDDEIPQYRKDIAYNIRYSGINGNFTVKSVPLSESFFTDEIKKILRERKITNGIGTIERNFIN